MLRVEVAHSEAHATLHLTEQGGAISPSSWSVRAVRISLLPAASQTLRAAAAPIRRGRDPFLWGAAAHLAAVAGDDAVCTSNGDPECVSYRATLADNYGALTPVNSCKWKALRPTASQFDFDGCDRLFEWAAARGQMVRGHALVWHVDNPDWLTEAIAAGEAESALIAHVSTVVARYSSTATAWDVVNEPIGRSGATWGARQSLCDRRGLTLSNRPWCPHPAGTFTFRAASE